VLEGTTGPRRLPFSFAAQGGIGRLALTDLEVGLIQVSRLELEVTDLGTDPGNAVAERFQRRRTRLRAMQVRISAAAVEQRVEAVRRQLAGTGITQVHARLGDGYVSVRARAADGLAAADISFRIYVVSAGTQLRALGSHIRVHGHLPAPGPVVADRVMTTLLGATDVAGILERPHVRGLCDVEIDPIQSLLWAVMPPAGWRLPAVSDVDLAYVRMSRASIEMSFGPTGSRSSDVGIRPIALALAAAHDLMHSADEQLRSGHIEEAMRGYRALLAAGGPEQPQLLERILALAAARPAWFFDGLELARQALGRWPRFPGAVATLASITLAQGDAREAASHLTIVAQQAGADGDDDQAALAALAGARLLRVLEPKSATQLYELALEHDPGSAEAADALADRLADEQRWPELVRLLRARAVTSDVARAVELRLRLADVFVHQLADAAGAQQELAIAKELAPDEPAVHEMTATILASSNPAAALDAWRDVARLAEARGDSRSAARAYATVGDLLAKRYAAPDAGDWVDAEKAWRRALEIDPLQTEAIAGLATAAAARGDHEEAVELYERLRGLGLPQHAAARHELRLAGSLVHPGHMDEARASLRRATLAGGETSAEAHAVLAEVAEAAQDKDHAAAELDTAISSFVGLASDAAGDDRLLTRAAELAMLRATLLDGAGHPAQASADYERAHQLARQHAPELARGAARTLLSRAGGDASSERRWIDAVLVTRPPALERASLLVQRADSRRREASPDVAAAIADLHEALALAEEDTGEAAAIRRRAYQLEADLLAHGGDQRARAQALSAITRMADRAGDRSDRIEVEAAAAAAWLAANEPATALPHSARAHAELGEDTAGVAAPLRRDVLTTLGEAAWRQRAWPDVIRAYRGLVDDAVTDTEKVGTYRYRLAVAADRTGDAALALGALAPLVDGLAPDAGKDVAEIAKATAPEMRAQALRLYADLAERAGKLAAAATALEHFAAVASDSTPTTRADAMYRAGELFRRAGQGDDAIRCLESALRISDSHLPALDALEHAWRERGDIERVSVILGRKVAATSRHPQRQKPLLSRLGDLQDQRGRPDVALATHQRALEIDSTWRPSLRYVTSHLRASGAVVAAAGGFAQLCGELPSDAGVDIAVIARERQLAAQALAALVVSLDDAQLEAVRAVVQPALERAALDSASDVASAIARLRGDPHARAPRPAGAPSSSEENTPSGRIANAPSGALSLREAARRSRAAGKLQDAYASLETANHVAPGDADLLRELVELATELEDHAAAAGHLAALAALQTGARKGETLLALADLYYDRLDDMPRARAAMRDAADAFGSGTRRDATLRMLASEAATHLAWDIAVEVVQQIDPSRRSGPDHVLLATALSRAGHPEEAMREIERATSTGKFDDGGLLLESLKAEVARRARYSETAPTLEQHVPVDPKGDTEMWHSIGSAVGVPALAQRTAVEGAALRDRLLSDQQTAPEDPEALQKLLAYLESREPELRRQVLERVSVEGGGRTQAIACHELALIARNINHDPLRAAALWQKAHRVDPSYTPVWMPLADALVAADELDLARELYEQVAGSTSFDGQRRRWASERADALGHDDSVVSGEIGGRVTDRDFPIAVPDVEVEEEIDLSLARARELAEDGRVADAITIAERAVTRNPSDGDALELLEVLYFHAGDVTAASEAIGRQLTLTDDPDQRAALWRRRAKLYRDTLGRDAEAYRCLKEAHACAPADPEIAYQLRTAAMVRGEWALVASLLYREIAAAASPRDRGALHLELALVYQEKLGDADQAQVNFEQALAFDPTIPAAKSPLAERYEAIGRHSDAAKLFAEAAAMARAADRPALLASAARNRAAASAAGPHAALAGQLDRAESAGDIEGAVDVANQLWKVDPGHPAAFRVLANVHRTGGDLAALTDITTVRIPRTANAAERASAWLDVARLASELGKHEDAVRAYDLALGEDPDNHVALEARGDLAIKLGDWATAERMYRELPANESVLGADDLALRRSVIAEQLGRHEEALALAKQAGQHAPGRSDVMMRIQHLATAVGELRTAIGAARAVLDLIPLADDEATLRTRHSLVELYRMVGEFDQAIAQLEHIVKDHPHHSPSIELIAEMYIAKNDWPTATRYLYQLVPLAPTPSERADRLFRLGEATLVHLGDVDRADDVFLRASDLDPRHIPTLRRLLDVYWRADDPGALVEVASQLGATGSLAPGPISKASLARALVAAALCGETDLARQLADALGDDAPTAIIAALTALDGRAGKLDLKGAATALAELGRRGILELGKLRAAAVDTPVESMLTLAHE